MNYVIFYIILYWIQCLLALSKHCKQQTYEKPPFWITFYCHFKVLYDIDFFTGKSKIELTPILIASGLNDIVILSAPIVNAKAIYYLHRPNGDAIELNFKKYKDSRKNCNEKLNKNTAEDNNVFRLTNFKIFNVNFETSCNDTIDAFKEKEDKMEAHDFMIGPLQEDDHGNWVLSAYYKDLDEHWIEMFQVITIEIIGKTFLKIVTS